MEQLQRCNFFLLKYVPDAVKNEFVNIGLVLLPESGKAELRFTRDWSRVRCLDAQADLELLEALEAEMREQLQTSADREFLLRKIQDSFSNALQPSEFKACLAESPAAEADALARLYLERPHRRAPRELGSRLAIFKSMRQEFDNYGVWRLMEKDIPAAVYTRSGDPLKIDCGYSPNGTIKMFHALALPGDVNGAKLLAFSFPQLTAGIRRIKRQQTELTTVLENDLDRNEDSIAFALDTLERQSVKIATLAQMPEIAATAARELGIA
jgi:hypothetical protein